jgi:hypothetical protein
MHEIGDRIRADIEAECKKGCAEVLSLMDGWCGLFTG